MKTMTKEYSILFNEITKVSEDLANVTSELTKVVLRLMLAQQQTEELFLDEEDTNALT
jgi:hypothetical protein